jgi:hypothetical protein
MTKLVSARKKIVRASSSLLPRVFEMAGAPPIARACAPRARGAVGLQAFTGHLEHHVQESEISQDRKRAICAYRELRLSLDLSSC